MPDRYGEEPITADRPDILAARRASVAIDDCNLCDENGIRNGFACDHIDHRPAAARGMAKIRAAMGWNR